jgi:Arginase/agmatinase/formimionoglutamate hydrolase, arginase family
MNHSPVGLHLNLDDAWPNEPLGLPVVDARGWGPQLRFSGPPRLVAEFYREHETHLAAPFMLYGSGDFHYLTALRLRSVGGPVVVVSFDNHPDWDVRPPKWGCGGWVSRAVELSQVRHVAVWGCGNFECWWPVQIFGNRRAERLGILEVHPWADDRPVKDRKRRGAILRDNWRKHYEQFLKSIVGEHVYITIDLDCLRAEEAVTNWESGRFTVADVEWALGGLRESSRIIGGDICGAFSEPSYVRWKQRFAAEFDHPKLARPSADKIRRINFATLEKLWPLLL